MVLTVTINQNIHLSFVYLNAKVGISFSQKKNIPTHKLIRATRLANEQFIQDLPQSAHAEYSILVFGSLCQG